MYDLHDYARMIADETRMGPYTRALEAVVKPGSVVVDVGTGTGIFALLACRLGARRVYAIETNDAIEVARELARENGCADRIVFVRDDARRVELPELADVLIADLRGVLPLHDEHLAIFADARRRFLRPGGALLPTRDDLMVGIVECAELLDRATGASTGPLGVTFETMRLRLHSTVLPLAAQSTLRREHLASESACWATLDYATLEPRPVSGRAELRVSRAAMGHGLLVWFESTLLGQFAFSAGPGAGLSTYGQVFLPWSKPVELAPGDVVAVQVQAQPDGDPWGWTTRVLLRDGCCAAFQQSSLEGMVSKPVPRRGVSPAPQRTTVRAPGRLTSAEE